MQSVTICDLRCVIEIVFVGVIKQANGIVIIMQWLSNRKLQIDATDTGFPRIMGRSIVRVHVVNP